MKLEPSHKQHELLNFIDFGGGKVSIEPWMHSSTIASLIGHQAIKVQVLKNSIKLLMQPQGYFMLAFKSPGRDGYFSNLKEVSTWRKR